jgi:20S proteasome alpha/beta subunit
VRKSALTIGIGFRCVDGIVIASDTQITYPGSHKRYEYKIFEHREALWSAIFTYAGEPDLMREFFGNFLASTSNPANTSFLSSCSGICKLIEISLRSVRRNAGLSIIGALNVVPNQELLMVKTSKSNISIARDYEFVGIGDSSLLAFLEKLICVPIGTGTYRYEQAFRIATYLVYQAKQYIDGCGGDTSVSIILPTGGRHIRDGATKDVEKEIKDLESRLSIAASLSFNQLVPAHVLEDNWKLVIDKLKHGHP